MGTKVQCKGYSSGYHSMKDLSDDFNCGSWSLYHGDKTFPNGHSYSGFFPRTIADSYSIDVVKQTMLKHEATFRNQVYELHRVYRIQRDLMNEIRRNGQLRTEDSSKWHFSSFAGSSASAPSFINGTQTGGVCLKDFLVSGPRPSKVGRKMIDLHLPADEYMEETDEENCSENNEVNNFLTSAPGLCMITACSKDLIDLNDPVQVEEACAEFPKQESSLQQASGLLGICEEILNNQFQDGKVNCKDQFSSMLETGYNKSVQKSNSQGQPEALLPAGRSNCNFQREKLFLDDEISKRCCDVASYSILSIEKPLPDPTSLNTKQIFGDNSSLGNNSKSNPDFRNVVSDRYGVSHGLPFELEVQRAVCHSSVSFNLANCQNLAIVPSGWHRSNGFNNSSGNHISVPNSVDLECNSSNGAFPHKGLEEFNGQRNIVTVLPWLTTEPDRMKDTTICRSNANEIGNGSGHAFSNSSAFCDGPLKKIMEKGDCSKTDRILGVPIFEQPHSPKDTPSSIPSLSVHLECQDDRGERGVMDKNMACDSTVSDFDRRPSGDPLVLVKGADSKFGCFSTDLIDLNSKVGEEESLASPSCCEKTMTDTQLEKSDDPDDELIMVAAETIVFISSSAATCSLQESLLWFAEAALHDPESKGEKKHKEQSSRGLDYFEFMTLKLRQVGVEECHSRPPLPGTPDDVSNHLRKVQARKWPRDFKHDILPGTVSLSRSEATEDLRTLGRLMRAMGHSWHSGPSRRNAAKNTCSFRKVDRSPLRPRCPPVNPP